jgi:hypothetical protein
MGFDEDTDKAKATGYRDWMLVDYRFAGPAWEAGRASCSLRPG